MLGRADPRGARQGRMMPAHRRPRRRSHADSLASRLSAPPSNSPARPSTSTGWRSHSALAPSRCCTGAISTRSTRTLASRWCCCSAQPVRDRLHASVPCPVGRGHTGHTCNTRHTQRHWHTRPHTAAPAPRLNLPRTAATRLHSRFTATWVTLPPRRHHQLTPLQSPNRNLDCARGFGARGPPLTCHCPRPAVRSQRGSWAPPPPERCRCTTSSAGDLCARRAGPVRRPRVRTRAGSQSLRTCAQQTSVSARVRRRGHPLPGCLSLDQQTG